MNKLKFILGLLIVFFLFPALALAAKFNLPYGYQMSQYYSVVFDSEGEASVLARLTYVNHGQDNLEKISINLPGQETRIIYAVQEGQELKKYCQEYDYNQVPPPGQERPCLVWAEEKNGSTVYSRLEYDKQTWQKDQGLQLDLNLNKAIASGEYGTVILFYKTKGLAEKVWNGYQYDFETLKSAFDIDYVRVAVNVADDLYIKATAKGEINYQADVSSGFLPTLSSSEFKASAPLSNISSSVQTSPGVIKETKSLDPNESFSVKGKYYLNQWLGEMPTIIGLGLTFIIIITILIIVIKKEKNKEA